VRSGLSFRLLLGPNPEWPNLRVADLLGRTPGLLNTYYGELGRPSVVFSPPPQPYLPTVDNLMDTADEEEDYNMEFNDDGDVDFEDQPRVFIKYFPIL